ncbi:hypothetical protein LJR220_000008 [Bradyrhizobium sp. LjRoot220]|uniref:hypothetical protein n=1 Tax=Bradyrhizobium sp. LjRoot220 TaxID=3342284 RepID=UPI003ECDFF47
MIPSCLFRFVRQLLIIAISFSPSLARADQNHVQFCWALGTFDNTIYFAEVESREDRQDSFGQLLGISGMDHHLVRCSVSDATSHRLGRAKPMQEWRQSELEIVNTTFLSDLDY